MALNDLTPTLQREAIERVGKLAQPATYGWNDTSLLQHPAYNKATLPTRSADLSPETESTACINNDAVQARTSATQILHLAKFKLALPFVHIGPQTRTQLVSKLPFVFGMSFDRPTAGRAIKVMHPALRA